MVSNFRINIFTIIFIIQDNTLLIHSEWISLVTGSVKDNLFETS